MSGQKPQSVKTYIKILFLAIFVYIAFFSVLIWSLSRTVGVDANVPLFGFLIYTVVVFLVYETWQKKMKFAPFWLILLIICGSFATTYSITGLMTIAPNRKVEVGVGTLEYLTWSAWNVTYQLQRIKDDGFVWIKFYYIALQYPSSDGTFDGDTRFVTTMLLMKTARNLGLKVCVIISSWWEFDEKFVMFFAGYVSAYQVLNEPDIMSYTIGTTVQPYMDDEILTIFKPVYDKIKKYDTEVKIVVNLSLLSPFRTSLVRVLSPYVDIFGIDIYTDQGREAAPVIVSYIKGIVPHMTVWVTEFGKPRGAQDADRDAFFIGVLDYCKRNGLPVAITTEWGGLIYGIEDTSVESAIKDWISRQ